MKRRTVDVIRVFRSAGDPRRGRLICGALSLPCALGRTGTTRSKREGDGGTPSGRLRALGIYFRADRVRRPRSNLPVAPIRRDLGWCEDPASRLYNRPVQLPAHDSHERMWRQDRLYDLVVDLSWNRFPRIAGRGSAIFLHAARKRMKPTQGCVALARRDLRRVVERIGPRTVFVIAG